MPKKIEPLTPVELNRKIEKLKQAGTQGLIAVGGVPGLHLQVTAAGATTWILRFTAGVKPGTDKPWRRDLGLGSYDKVSMKDAREKAKQAHALIADGIDPITEKREARSAMIAARLAEITFEEAAKQFIAAQSVTWKEGGKSEHQWSTAWRITPIRSSARCALPTSSLRRS